MKCFSFSNGDKRVEPKSSKGMSVRSVSGSGSRSGSEPNSQNISSTSNESLGRPAAPNVFDRPSNLRVFTFSELKLVTRNFTRSAMVGAGGFGSVYKGMIKNPEDPNRRVEVAVKQLDKKSMQGHKQWVTEVNVLGVVEHRNLVKLVGYSAENDERGAQRLLVYEYMPKGSVDDHLSHRSKQPLPWAVRLRIAQDAARGLAYLHEGMDFQIIFRDFKSSNILLDEQWNAKLSDFGLARLGPEEGFTHVSTAVMGTLGYAAPEYMQSGRLTAKSDVWSYGVFLFELITGRRPLDRNRPKNEQNLLEWMRPYVSDKKRFNLIIDPRLEGDVPLGSAQRLAILANDCLIRNHKSRPSMREVLEMVNKIVEEYLAETGSPRPPLNGSARVEISRDVKSMKGVGDSRIEGDGGFVRRRASKLVKTH